MKKKIKPIKLILLIILGVVIVAGGTLAIIIFCRPKQLPANVTPTENEYIDGNEKSIDECTPLESLFILASNLKKASSYSSTISGEVDALGFKQNVSGEKYRANGASLYVSRSTGAKTTAEQIYIESETVLVRKGNPNTNVYEDNVTKYTLENYLKTYGTDYRELCNYELNQENITKAELVSITDGIYKFRYEIDVTKGVENYRVNMQKMGDLAEMPKITASTLIVEMNADFMPITVTMQDTYTVNYVVIDVTCNSTITERFERINDNSVTIPEAEFFKAKLGE